MNVMDSMAPLDSMDCVSIDAMDCIRVSMEYIGCMDYMEAIDF